MTPPDAPEGPPAVDPLSALLSKVLVALTIEMDNTYESRAPHRTTRSGGSGPWLISYAMWANFLRLVPDEGIPAGELSLRSGQGRRALSAKAGMIRWGYVSLAPADGSVRTTAADLVVRPKKGGRLAGSVWAEVPPEVESRWRDRFGADLVDRLRSDAEALARLAGCTLPAYLPVLGPLLLTGPPRSDPTPGPPGLVTALANALHAFAIDVERDWPVGLAAVANPLRVLGDPVRLADLPRLTGISREAVAFASGVLGRLGALEMGADPAIGRGRIVALAAGGRDLQAAYRAEVARVEEDWSSRASGRAATLRSGLEAVLGHDGGATVRVGLRAPEGTWRARVRTAGPLPHFPFVWHRGGFPDGA
jgi:hypothetical protein